MIGWSRSKARNNRLSRVESGRSRKPVGIFGRPAIFSGFTLIEIMIAIALVAILMAIAFPVARGITESQQRSRCAVNMEILGRHLLALRDDYQAFPRDRFEIDNSVSPGLGQDITTPRFPGIVGLYALYYLTEYTGEYNVIYAGSGTATFTNGSKTITGSGTTWATSGLEMVLPGDRIMLNSAAHWCTVASVESDTSLSLLEAYPLLYSDGSGAFSVQKILAEQPWFSGGNYLRRLATLHCPANLVLSNAPEVTVPPLLGDNPGNLQKPGYNNYDLYYCRDWFDKADNTFPYPDSPTDKRNLVASAYPPADTLITFCPYHRRSQDFTVGHPERGDQDIVLFADGAVKVLPSFPWNPLDVTADPQNPAEWFSQKRAEKGE